MKREPTITPDDVPRRKFLQSAMTMGVAPLISDPLKLAPPNIHHEASARLLPGCCAYSYAKLLKSGQMSMEDFIRKGVELGVSGVDITGYWLKFLDPPYLAGLRHLAYKNGMPFSGAACGADMTQGTVADRNKILDEIKKWVDATNELGASHLRVFAGELPKNSSVEQAVGWTVEVMKAACDYAGQRGITLGLEDDSGIGDRAEVVLEIIRRTDSPFAGINLDITNFAARSDEELYREIEACIPYATHVHIRDRFESTKSEVDLDRIWKLFVKYHYHGYMSAEYEGDEDAITGAPKLVAKVKELCRKYSSL